MRSEWRGKTLRVTGPARDGFWVRVHTVLDQIFWAKAHGIRSFVVVHNSSDDAYLALDAQPHSGWEPYFLPPTTAPTQLAELREDRVLEMDCQAAWHLYPRRDEAYPRTMEVANAVRQRRAQQVQRWAQVQPAILREASGIWGRLFRHRADAQGHRKRPAVLGVHMRGTDKKLRPKVPPEHYLPFIKAFLAHHGPDARVFLATDDRAFQATTLRTVGRERVVQQNGGLVLRGSQRKAVWHAGSGGEADANGRRRGLEVLLDTLLLSRCDFLLKSASAVGEFAIAYNPQLINHSFDFNIADSPMPPWARHLRRPPVGLGGSE